MRFCVSLITIIACAAGVIADVHDYAWCEDRSFEGFNEQNTENSAATKKACTAYRNRNTGNQQWDKCPDCTTSFRGDLLVCNSLGWHIGGDEWQYYCRQAGADIGKAN
ncbi:hypothetical protein CCHL11_08606 [Colletotrichum chlorophyti]|uniref:Cyanovirin-N domain-containing protein n=1 Tax=Colletotrichum chlorophyti TaxID=708187 RepID=A0A1Q8RCF4_9PEZI|nr:hypothetical protein CCHL11_08606 [Colletotrichum chlorophyti]